MNISERIEQLRKEALNVLELSKEYTPEQREYLGNLLYTAENLSKGILELIYLLDIEKLKTKGYPLNIQYLDKK
jgi:hypothetical protein